MDPSSHLLQPNPELNLRSDPLWDSLLNPSGEISKKEKKTNIYDSNDVNNRA